MFLIPVSEELKAFLDVMNHRTVHASNDLFTENASLKYKVASLQVLFSFHNHSSIWGGGGGEVLFLSNLSEHLSCTFAAKRNIFTNI